MQVNKNKNISFSLHIRNYLYTFAGFLNNFFSIKRPRIIIYCYHSISNDGWRFSVTEDMFKKQIEILLKWGSSITVHDLEMYIQREKKITGNAFLITFDDGYEDILKVKDFLKEKNIFPMAFVLSNTNQAKRDELETDRPFLSQNQIKELKRAGWDIGSHSAIHPDFKKISFYETEKEVKDSKIDLEKELGFSIETFAYPKGAYTSHIRQVVKEAGYTEAFSMDDECINNRTDQFLIPRVGVDGTHNLEQFQNLALPFSMAVRKVIKKFM